uniref:Ig-like domain-containing protein n=1 Tax=Xiphophorus couchianus TaxID=32473 RepID=A0A3B5MMV1_9TELE
MCIDDFNEMKCLLLVFTIVMRLRRLSAVSLFCERIASRKPLTCLTYDVLIQCSHLVSLQRSAGNGSRMRIFYSDVNQQIVDNNTDYSGRIEVTSDQRGNTLLIQNVQLSDEKEFFCQVNGQEAGNAERKTHLRVFAPPEAPEIEGVPNGISVTNTMPSKVASCEVRNGFPKPNITWYKDSEPLVPKVGQVNVIILVTRESRGFYSVQSTLEYRTLKEDKDSHFSCEVSFSVPGAIRTRMSQSINVTVHYPTTMMELWKDSPQGLVKEGDTVELRCQGDGNPPPIYIFSKEQPDAPLESRGDVLILPSVTRKDSGIYQCRVLDTAGQTEVKEEVTLTVHYLDPAVVVPKDLEYMDKGENLVASCNALSSLKTVTIWYKEGKQVGYGNTLHLNDATYETSGQYVCEVTVPSLPSLHTNGSVHIIVQGGPQLAGVEDEIQLEEVAGRTLNLSCEARGHPLPSITWSITGSQNWQEVMSKANDHMTHSMVSVKINSDVSAVCNASNNQGTEVKVFSIKASKRLFLIRKPTNSVEGSGVIIVVIILCLLLLAFLGSVVYFLHKKGKIPCGRSGKQEITKEKPTKDDIVVEMKNNPKNEEAVLLKAVNGEKKGPNDQVTVVVSEYTCRKREKAKPRNHSNKHLHK